MSSLGWTSSENLVVVVEDGSMAVYTIHGQQVYGRIITRVRSWVGELCVVRVNCEFRGLIVLNLILEVNYVF